MQEAKFQQEVEQMLKARPALLWHHCARRAQYCRGSRGLPDLLIVGNRMIAVELKQWATGAVRGHQIDWKYRLPLAGVSWEVWDERHLRNGHIERVLDGLVEMGQLEPLDAFRAAMAAPERD